MPRTQQSFNAVLCFLIAAGLSACASSRATDLAVTSEQENPQEAVSALGEVAESYAGRQLTEEEKRALVKDIQKDPEAQSAVKAIADSMETNTAKIKYSPATGKRYSADLEYDPETGVKLIPLEP